MTGVHTAADKRVALDALAELVRDGDVVALGGGLTCRLPMAAVRALVRRGARDLTVVGSAHGIDVDLLCGAGAVAASAESYVGFEVDFGMAPNYRRACESGAVAVSDSCCYTLVQQLRATIAGLPFMPLRSIRGTDMGRLNPGFRTMTCPYTGDELILAPAVADLLFARASRTVLATVERIVENEELAALGGANVPYFYVTALAEAELGAHPTACYPNYAYDRAHTALYYEAAKAGADAFRARYLDPYVLECPDHAAYLERAGGSEMRSRVRSWGEGGEAWQRLYAEVPG
jgi:glutaconate CoA-transferase subunit A